MRESELFTEAQKEIVFQVMLRQGQQLLDLVRAHGLQEALRLKDQVVATGVQAALDELEAARRTEKAQELRPVRLTTRLQRAT